MGVILPGQGIIRLLNDFFQRLAQQQQATPAPIIDSLRRDIYQLEQTLSTISYESSHVSPKSVSVEHITEQQKIIDLSG